MVGSCGWPVYQVEESGTIEKASLSVELKF